MMYWIRLGGLYSVCCVFLQWTTCKLIYPKNQWQSHRSFNTDRLQLKSLSQTKLKQFNSFTRTLPVLSELQRMVSFSRAPGPCLIHTEMVKGSFRLVLTMPSGTLIAWVPLNSNTWSLSCPLSVGSPTVQLAELLGDGRSSTVPELAPKENIQSGKWKLFRVPYFTEYKSHFFS